jgi:hypothetical protein
MENGCSTWTPIFDDFFAHFYTGKCGYNFAGGLQNIRIV